MAALAADRNTPARRGELISVAVKAATRIFAGSLVCKAAGGLAEPGRKAAALTALGRAEAQADNSGGASGDLQVLVRRGVFRWANDPNAAGKIARTDLYADCYMLDDQTVTKTDTGASKAGKIVGLDDEGVWVETL